MLGGSFFRKIPSEVYTFIKKALKLSNHQNTELKTSVSGQNNGQLLLLFLDSCVVSVTFPKTVIFFYICLTNDFKQSPLVCGNS